MADKQEIFRIQPPKVRLTRIEKVRVLRILRHLLPFSEVKETGSTAVPGVIGKQDLDFLVKVKTPQFRSARSTLDENFLRNAKQVSNENIQGYLIDSHVDIALQLVVENSEYDIFDEFVSALKHDPNLRLAYNHLKIQWDGMPMDDYRKAKRAFIEAILYKRPQVPHTEL